jgi:hypothetical protein
MRRLLPSRVHDLPSLVLGQSPTALPLPSLVLGQFAHRASIRTRWGSRRPGACWGPARLGAAICSAASWAESSLRSHQDGAFESDVRTGG